MCESLGKAVLLSDQFDREQSRESVNLPLTCHPSSSRTTFTLMSSEARRLLLDLDPYGGTDDPNGYDSFLSQSRELLMLWLPVLV